MIETKAMKQMTAKLKKLLDEMIQPLENFEKDMVKDFAKSPAKFLDNCDRAFEYMARLVVLRQIKNALTGKDSKADFESIHQYVLDTVIRGAENSGTSSSTTGTYFERCELQGWSRLLREMEAMKGKQ